MLKYLVIFTSALISSMLCTFLVAKAFLRHKILKVGNIPLAGGLGIGLAFVFSSFLAVFMFSLPLAKVLMVMVASVLVLLFGVVDDLKESSVAQKFLVQSLCAGLLILSGIRTGIIYFGFWGNAIITFFWILGVTNAFNLLDIMDGLAAGTALIVGGAFLLIGFLSADLNVQLFSLILCASSCGFLIFNLPPARAYLGNSGSHFLGMLIACIALITHYASGANVFALLTPVIILGLPIMDTILLIIFRIIKRRPPFQKSNDHIALKIGSLGFSKGQTIVGMYLLSFLFAGCGVLLTRASNLSAAAIIMAIFLFSTGVFLRLVKIEANA